jgi:hypothetical protein
VHPDEARELKAHILDLVQAGPASQAAGQGARAAERPRVAVGLAPVAPGSVVVAVRLESDADRAVLADLGPAAEAELQVRVIGPIRALSSTAPPDLQRRVRPLRPGLSVAHPTVTAGTLGGFVRVTGGLAVLSNNHVLAASDAAALGDPVLQPGPADGGGPDDRIATLAAFERLPSDDTAGLVDAAVATLDPGIEASPGDLPGGPLATDVPPGPGIDPDELVEKVGRTTGHTRGRITAVEVDGVTVQYDSTVHRFDNQVEVEGATGAFSAGGDSGSVIWRSRDRAPLALLFAGSETGGSAGGGVTFGNPLSTVLQLLKAAWVAS